MTNQLAIKCFTFVFNSYLGYKCTVTLYDDGIVHYQSNYPDVHCRDSVFLRNQEAVKKFLSNTTFILNWQENYGTTICIDGYSWNIKAEFTDGSIKESAGTNEKPDDFGEFVDKFEKLINKPLDFAQLLREKEQ